MVEAGLGGELRVEGPGEQSTIVTVRCRYEEQYSVYRGSLYSHVVIPPIVSIVVPAHNEEAVLANGLSRLLDGTAPGEFDVVVVANACSDRTAEVAAKAGVRVVETVAPGKANALRLGDEECRTFPRAYVDADVELTAQSVRALVAAAAEPGVLACAPVPRWDLSGAGRIAVRVHKVHEQLIAPYRALSGVGVYVLTEEGHARVFPMPDVISDDGLVHRSFTPEERRVVRDAWSLVRPARTVSGHLKRRVRVRQGNRQLDALGAPLPEGRLELGALRALVATRRVSPLDAACYLAVLVLDRVLTRVRTLRGRQGHWGTDASSRTAMGG
ncbi:hypothetical protein Pph01_28700 [Planotetraspora phitsanulokensis]|uniref:4,4'-diaponeurosporenoate glycosyltransferase n=1 Tax=Planotetraspora phitsanulokensis TaxID=575192 RepID=A0A8J3XDZ1_9ACTN|nr:hypothetical protein Pph01_28700 [Planotetraspora phitsanulokensis]